MKKRIHTITASLLMAAAMTGLLTGCGAGGKASSSQANSMVAETAAAAAMDSFEDSGGRIQHPEFEMAQGEEPVEHAGGTLTSTNTMQPVSSSRKLIRNVNLSVETTEFDTLITNLTDSVSSLGGYIEDSEISGNSVSSSYNGNRYAYLTVRVPSDRLDTFIMQVEEQGNITNRSESTQDVTLQYSDIESRKKSLAIEQERLWALLEKADTLEAVIALESRLSEIRYQLESFESQLRTYDNQVDYSSVHINISEVTVFTPTTPDSVLDRIQKGFSRNLNRVKNALISFFVWLISSLPVLILIAIIAAIVILIIRLTTKNRPPKEPRHQNPPKKNAAAPVPPLTQPLPPLKPGPGEQTQAEDREKALEQQNQQNQ